MVQPMLRFHDSEEATAALRARRSDIREAEQQLSAATAEIGVAQTDFFPRTQPDGLGRPAERGALDLLER